MHIFEAKKSGPTYLRHGYTRSIIFAPIWLTNCIFILRRALLWQYLLIVVAPGNPALSCLNQIKPCKGMTPNGVKKKEETTTTKTPQGYGADYWNSILCNCTPLPHQLSFFLKIVPLRSWFLLLVFLFAMSHTVWCTGWSRQITALTLRVKVKYGGAEWFKVGFNE